MKWEVVRLVDGAVSVRLDGQELRILKPDGGRIESQYDEDEGETTRHHVYECFSSVQAQAVEDLLNQLQLIPLNQSV